MGLLTFALNVTLDGSCDHREGLLHGAFVNEVVAKLPVVAVVKAEGGFCLACGTLARFAGRTGVALSSRDKQSPLPAALVAISSHRMDRIPVRAFPGCRGETPNALRIGPGQRFANHTRPSVGKND
jgi:hypothetical protein